MKSKINGTKCSHRVDRHRAFW